MKFFDFGVFQKIEKMLSHDKILFHMLFGAFHDTSCISIPDLKSILDSPLKKNINQSCIFESSHDNSMSHLQYVTYCIKKK